jgi:hypothetical protein
MGAGLGFGLLSNTGCGPGNSSARRWRRQFRNQHLDAGSDWVMALSLSWKATDTAATVQPNRTWQNEFYDAVVPFALPESYQNFIDPSLNNWPQAWYGSNLVRLRRVKAQVDPHRIFRFPQGIAPG